MPVEDQKRALQGFIALETIIEGVKAGPQRIVVQKGEDPTGGVGAGQPRVEAAPPERVFLVLFQGVEAAQASHGHQKDRREDNLGRNHRPPASIGQGGKKAWGFVSTFRISQEATKNRLPLLFLSFQPVPIGGGDLLQKLQNLAVALDPEPDHLFLILRDIELFDLALSASG